MRICLKDLIKRGWIITETGCAAKFNDAKDIQFAFSMRDNGDETVTPLVGYIMSKDGGMQHRGHPVLPRRDLRGRLPRP